MTLRDVNPWGVPGLLQTADYAQARPAMAALPAAATDCLGDRFGHACPLRAGHCGQVACCS